MSGLSRRGFIGSAAAGLAAAEADRTDFAFKNNVPDELLAGHELPTFKFELEKSTAGRVVAGNEAREATVKQLPISKGIAGVSMRLEPGGSRELHWHATAAEWAYVVEGRVRTTVIDPEGNFETDDFGPGDIWYFPRGHGHSLQGLGPGTTRFILIFDNGYFSEFGTFSITDWIGHSPVELVRKNLGLSPELIAKLPREEVYFGRGPVPPAEPVPTLHGTQRSPRLTHKYELLKQQPHSVHSGGREWRVGADRFPISQTITGVILELAPGGLRELHWHPTSDEWQYVLSGKVHVTMFGSHGRYRIETLERGDVGYIPQGYGHSIENASETEATRILIGFNTGHYEAIDLSAWIAGNPRYLIENNFGISATAAESFPRDRVFIAPKDGPSRQNDGYDVFPSTEPGAR
jgi:oxalate decarboxylase